MLRDYTVTYEHFRCACGKVCVPVSTRTGYGTSEKIPDGKHWHSRAGCVYPRHNDLVITRNEDLWRENR